MSWLNLVDFHDGLTKAYASGFFGKTSRALTPDECAEEAKKYADQGFKGIKMKVGFDPKTDLHQRRL